MSRAGSWNLASRIVAVLLIAVSYGLTRPPSVSKAERDLLAESFAFEGVPLPTLRGAAQNSIRAVHPSLEMIDAWISSVGAGVALADLDNDTFANDLCVVDPRSDAVIVQPVPGTGARYAAFRLDAPPGDYDPATVAPMGAVPGDFNEDGRMDVVVYYWGRTPVIFQRVLPGMGPGSFIAVPLVEGSQRWFTNALTTADVNGDGHVDLIVGNYFADQAAILDPTDDAPQRMQHSMSRAANAGVNRLFLGRPDGVTCAFELVSEPWSDAVARGWTLAVAAGDLDGDLLPEIYFANDFGPDRLLHNRSENGTVAFAVVEGKKGFTTPNSKVLGHDSFKGMGAEFADLDGDGLLDIYVSNIAAEFALEESHFLYVNTGDRTAWAEGRAPFRDASEPLGLSRSGWGWDAKLADFNNDGILEAIQATGFVRGEVNRWPELHEIAMGNDELLQYPASWHKFRAGDDLSGSDHNPFFVRRGERFVDLAPELGLDIPQVSRGIAIGDPDGDGDLDFVVANQWDVSRYYENTRVGSEAHLALRILAPAGSGYRPAVGAWVEAALEDGRRLVSLVDGGNGHSGVRSPEVHFGLGESSGPAVVTVRWIAPGGVERRMDTRLAPGRHTLVLRDDAGRGE